MDDLREKNPLFSGTLICLLDIIDDQNCTPGPVLTSSDAGCAGADNAWTVGEVSSVEWDGDIDIVCWWLTYREFGIRGILSLNVMRFWHKMDELFLGFFLESHTFFTSHDWLTESVASWGSRFLTGHLSDFWEYLQLVGGFKSFEKYAQVKWEHATPRGSG